MSPPSVSFCLTTFRLLPTLLLRMVASPFLATFQQQVYSMPMVKTSAVFSNLNSLVLRHAAPGQPIQGVPDGMGPCIQGSAANRGSSMLQGWSMSAVAVCMFLLVVASGVLSGLTLALVSIDMTRLRVLAVSGTEKEKKMANAILPVKKYPYFLLCSLLIASVLVNEMLPILNTRLFGENYKALLVSASLIMVFGEIIPQAVFPKFALELGSGLIWVVYLCMGVCSIPAALLSSALYYVLQRYGPSQKIFTSEELMTFIDLHSEDHMCGYGGPLDSASASLIKNVIYGQEMLVKEVMKVLKDVYIVNGYTPAGSEQLRTMLSWGYSRIPVYEASRETYVSGSRLTFMGCIETKSLLGAEPPRGKRVRDLRVIPLPIIDIDSPVYDLLPVLRSGKARMALVADPSKEAPTMNGRRTRCWWRTNPHTQLEVGMGRRVFDYFENELIWTNDPVSHRKKIVGIITLEDVVKILLCRRSKNGKISVYTDKEKERGQGAWDCGSGTTSSDGSSDDFIVMKSYQNPVVFSGSTTPLSASSAEDGEVAVAVRMVTRETMEQVSLPLRQLSVNVPEMVQTDSSVGPGWDDIEKSGVVVSCVGVVEVIEADTGKPAPEGDGEISTPKMDSVAEGEEVTPGGGGLLRRRFSFEDSVDELGVNLVRRGDMNMLDG